MNEANRKKLEALLIGIELLRAAHRKLYTAGETLAADEIHHVILTAKRRLLEVRKEIDNAQ